MFRDEGKGNAVSYCFIFGGLLNSSRFLIHSLHFCKIERAGPINISTKRERELVHHKWNIVGLFLITYYDIIKACQLEQSEQFTVYKVFFLLSLNGLNGFLQVISNLLPTKYRTIPIQYWYSRCKRLNRSINYVEKIQEFYS